MKSATRYRNLLIALMVSIALNGILAVVAFIASSKHGQRLPRVARLLDLLATPSNAIAERLAPPGHGAAHFIEGAIAAAISSVFFYAILVWLALAIWTRVHQSLPKHKGSPPAE